MYAFFHNVPEKGLDRIRTDNPPPRLPVPTQEQALRFVEADFALKDAEKTLQDRANELGETQEKWERETNEKPPPKPNEEGLAAALPFDDSLAVASSPSSSSRPKPRPRQRSPAAGAALAAAARRCTSSKA